LCFFFRILLRRFFIREPTPETLVAPPHRLRFGTDDGRYLARPRICLYAGVIAALVGIGLVVTGLVQYYQAKPPSNQSAHTTGVITSAATNEHRCINIAYFVFHGQRYSAATRISLDFCHFAVGERAPVSYDPSDPSSASVVLPTSETLGLAEIGMIVGLIGAALASCVLVGSAKREPRTSSG
jgi:hypothetical protein